MLAGVLQVFATGIQNSFDGKQILSAPIAQGVKLRELQTVIIYHAQSRDRNLGTLLTQESEGVKESRAGVVQRALCDAFTWATSCRLLHTPMQSSK